jgi:hypothetical protein
LFQWYDQTEQAVAARELVEQINLRIAEIRNEKQVHAENV